MTKTSKSQSFAAVQDRSTYKSCQAILKGVATDEPGGLRYDIIEDADDSWTYQVHRNEVRFRVLNNILALRNTGAGIDIRQCLR